MKFSFVWLTLWLLGLPFGWLAAYSEEQETNVPTGNPFQEDKVDKAIEKAVSFLAKKQQADGSIHDRGNQTTMTSLSLMAMAAVGNQPV